jgi:uncharacterized RDD family membrane protein YckC
MKQKNADLILLIQAGLLGISPLLAMFLLKTKSYALFYKVQEFLFISKISLTDQRWFFALLISIAAAAGITIYYQSGKTKRGALLFLSSFAFLKSLVFLPLIIKSVFFTENSGLKGKTVMFLVLAYYLLWFVSSLICLVYFTRKERKLLLQPDTPAPANPQEGDLLELTDLNMVELAIAGKEKRFANYLADTFLIILVAGPVLSYFLGFGLENIYTTGKYKITLLQTLVGTVAYYGLFECCFKCTPGKYLTGSRIIHRDGKPASVLQGIARTLCRLIPFDHFSFLGTTGWHDSITKTEVVDNFHEKE